jgi:hypothetical protein
MVEFGDFTRQMEKGVGADKHLELADDLAADEGVKLHFGKLLRR